MVKLTLRKDIPASQSYGRSMDNTRTPARYIVLVNDVAIGAISGSSARPFTRPVWSFTSYRTLVDNVPDASTRTKLLKAIEVRLNPEKGNF